MREDEYFQTGGRHIAELRKRQARAGAYLHPDDARATAGVGRVGWVAVGRATVACAQGRRPRQHAARGRPRPHGWWKPEMPQGPSKSCPARWEFADALLCSDDEDFLDREQGIPHLKGVPCRIAKLGEHTVKQGAR